MRERKFVKLRVDMHEDTKFKIIDKMKERDLVHYIWIRLVTLAGKVNLEGDLYLSRNIPYTIETLAIEFNRDTEQVKLALSTLIDLEMIELLKDKIYRVKNFAKHQNIKIEEKVEFQDNMEEINHKELIIENQLGEEKYVDSEHQICESIEKAPKNQVIADKSINSEIINKEKIDSNCKNIKDYQFISDGQSNIPISLEKKKPKKVNQNTSKNISCIDEDSEGNKEDQINGFFEGEHIIPMGKDDRVIMAFSV